MTSRRGPASRLWYGGLLHGDLGRSVLLQQSVGEGSARTPASHPSLTVVSLGLACLIGIPAGLLAAAKITAMAGSGRHGRRADRPFGPPDFWLGFLVLIWVVGVKLGWLPHGWLLPRGAVRRPVRLAATGEPCLAMALA